ncbi:MAG: NAD-dependent epimerase/dehydratase family protein [Bacteroidales bacterium]|nr:NAD-dependent epimerase/dehydratase family protein [Bacteroidales bacterium]
MILVTGGTGLVGSHLLFELVIRGKKVTALKRENSNLLKVQHVFSYYSNNYSDLFAKITWINGDILDYDSICHALEGTNEIYHTAGMVSFNPKEKEIIKHINIQGTKNIVNAALEKKIDKLCYVSSVAAVGNPYNEDPVNENYILTNQNAKSIYAYSKLNAELEVWRGIAEGLNAVIVNPSIILGPGDWGKSSSKIFKTIWQGFKFYTKGITGFVDVRDVCTIMADLMEKNIFNERFIINAENISYKILFQKIAKDLDVSPPNIYASPFLSGIAWRLEKLRAFILNPAPVITKETAKSGHSITYYSNNKIVETLGYQFLPIDRSIKEICQFFIQDVNNNMIITDFNYNE